MTSPLRKPTVTVAFAALLLSLCGASQADAKPKHVPAKAKHGVKAAVAHRTLTVTGNERTNRITLRAARRRSLQVDVQNDGSADFSFKRGRFTRIVVRAGAGADSLTVANLAGTGVKQVELAL